MVLVVKTPPAIEEMQADVGSVSGLGRFPGGGHGNPFQYSCLEDPMDSGAWWGLSEESQRDMTEATSRALWIWDSFLLF